MSRSFYHTLCVFSLNNLHIKQHHGNGNLLQNLLTAQNCRLTLVIHVLLFTWHYQVKRLKTGAVLKQIEGMLQNHSLWGLSWLF